MTELAMKVCGARALLKTNPLERYIRDTRSAPLMPPTSERCLESIGKVAAGLEATTIGFRPAGSTSDSRQRKTLVREEALTPASPCGKAGGEGRGVPPSLN